MLAISLHLNIIYNETAIIVNFFGIYPWNLCYFLWWWKTSAGQLGAYFGLGESRFFSKLAGLDEQAR